MSVTGDTPGAGTGFNLYNRLNILPNMPMLTIGQEKWYNQ